MCLVVLALFVLLSINNLNGTKNKLDTNAKDSNVIESNLQVSTNNQGDIAIQSNGSQSQSKLYGVNEMVVDDNLRLSSEDRDLMRVSGIKYLKIDPNSQYKAQYLDGGITARNQVEFDKYKYHELGHHIFMTKMSADDKGLFDGRGYASKQAIGRPGYTELDVISEDFAVYFDLAMQGRMNEVPEKYRTVVSKYRR